MLDARRYVISGRVQGVGFRFFAENVARREGLSGFIRNLSDGRVEATVEGEIAAVDRFEMALCRGPAGARVEAVESDRIAPTGRFTGFAIR